MLRDLGRGVCYQRGHSGLGCCEGGWNVWLKLDWRWCCFGFVETSSNSHFGLNRRGRGVGVSCNGLLRRSGVPDIRRR